MCGGAHAPQELLMTPHCHCVTLKISWVLTLIVATNFWWMTEIPRQKYQILQLLTSFKYQSQNRNDKDFNSFNPQMAISYGQVLKKILSK